MKTFFKFTLTFLHKREEKRQFSKTEILYIYIRRFYKEEIMNEKELNATMSVIADPIKNVYKLESRKDVEEIQRICRIFAISDRQANKHKMLSIKNLAKFRLVLSNN